MDKEKIENFVLCSLAMVAMIIVFYGFYDYGLGRSVQEDIPVGQEYRVKEVTVGTNSSFLVRYHENDNNMTEKLMVSTDINKFNLTLTNFSQSIMALDKIENNVKYWNIYISDKQTNVSKRQES